MEAGGLTNVVTGALWPHAEHPLHSSRLPCQVVAVGWEEWLDLWGTLFRQSQQEF